MTLLEIAERKKPFVPTSQAPVLHAPNKRVRQCIPTQSPRKPWHCGLFKF